MAYKEIRALRADEIECRIGQISKDGKGGTVEVSIPRFGFKTLKIN